ncbi:hypothetical protein, partial [Photobacterium sp. 2_MG-2023]|uniref:hypothetical protein n=1 Tax=Photobacterium sp. 2_MG-2023 TaxID=3062663 RepID=UPI0026E37CB6
MSIRILVIRYQNCVAKAKELKQRLTQLTSLADCSFCSVSNAFLLSTNGSVQSFVSFPTLPKNGGRHIMADKY